jgi:iron complex transport system ATP-binding protein
MDHSPTVAVAGPPARTGLQLSGLTVGYRHTRRWPLTGADRVIVSGVDATAEAGRVTAILGPNGAGKSTLLRSVAGLQPVLAGRVLSHDRNGTGTDLLRLSSRQRARRLAVVLTERVDAGLLTGREVVELGRHPYLSLVGRLSGRDHRLIGSVLADLNATELADQRFAELSDGQRQRLLLARALVAEPELLILDEPSAFLDVGARIDLMALLDRVARERMITVLVSTHEVELALRMADRLWLIHDHELTSGTPAELIAAGLIGRVFGTAHAVFDPASGTFGVRR